MSSRDRISSAVFTTAASSSPSPRAPHLALAAATARVRSGTFRPEEAHDLFDELLRQATPVPERALNGFLSALARAPSSAACRDGPALAVALFSRASRADGPQVLSPTLCTYSIIMDCCTRAHRPELTLALFGQLLKKGLGVDIIIIMLDRATSIFNEMREQGVKPDVVTYSTVMDGYCLVGKMEKALRVFDAMVSAGIEPDVVGYGTLVNGYCKIGRIDEGLTLFREILHKGMKPSTILYDIILHGLFQAGRTVSAMEMFHEMTESGISVDTSTCNIVLSGLFKNSCSDKAILFFEELRAMNAKIDIKTLSIMIYGMFRTRRVKEAKDLFASVSGSGLVPSIVTYNIMITNLIKEGLVEEADEMFSSMENSGCDPDSRLLNHVVRELLEKNEIVRAGTYLSKMDERNFSLEHSTTTLLIDLFSSNGIFRQHIRFLPAKYHFLAEASPY